MRYINISTKKVIFNEEKFLNFLNDSHKIKKYVKEKPTLPLSKKKNVTIFLSIMTVKILIKYLFLISFKKIEYMMVFNSLFENQSEQYLIYPSVTRINRTSY